MEEQRLMQARAAAEARRLLKRQYKDQVIHQEASRMMRMACHAEEAMQEAAHRRISLSKQEQAKAAGWSNQVQNRHRHFQRKWDRMDQAQGQYHKRRSDALDNAYRVNHPEFGQIDIRQARSAGTLGANIALSLTPSRKHRTLTPIGQAFPLQGKHSTIGTISPQFDRQFMGTRQSVP
jgi:hypothetical protein